MSSISATVENTSISATLQSVVITTTGCTINGGYPQTTIFSEYIYAGHYSTSIFPEEIDLGNEVTYADLTGGTPDGTYTSIGTISGGTPATTGIYDIIDGGYI